MSTHHIRKHGFLRGLDATRLSDTHEGRFGRMFRTLPRTNFIAHNGEDPLAILADAMSAKKEGAPTPETERDDEENPAISAGYTYLGQFIDHDITFDPASSLQKENDPESLVDFRTPAFDLDNMYGRGPDDQPYLYESDGKKFILGRTLTGSLLDANTKDLQRNTNSSGVKRAIIGDPRNDENVIISQLQSVFLRFHNSLVDMFPTADFASIQRLVRWHYQWVVLHDFLPTIIGNTTFADVYPLVTKNGKKEIDASKLKFYKWKNDPFIPVEFSVAAYRFGHSMVRPIYRLNQNIDRFAIFSNDPNTSLTGFREFPSDWAIDWRLFFDFKENPAPNPLSSERIQPAYKIDSSLVNPLADLPPSIASHPSNLALRNLQRGRSLGLPSGQHVARKMGIEVIHDEQLTVGKANEDGMKKDATGKIANPTIASLHPVFANNAPLWFYILAESQQVFTDNDTPIHLGPVGGRIVGEVFVGLLLGDKHSFLNQQPDWQPLNEFKNDGKFGIVELIKQAIKP